MLRALLQAWMFQRLGGYYARRRVGCGCLPLPGCGCLTLLVVVLLIVAASVAGR